MPLPGQGPPFTLFLWGGGWEGGAPFSRRLGPPFYSKSWLPILSGPSGTQPLRTQPPKPWRYPRPPVRARRARPRDGRWPRGDFRSRGVRQPRLRVVHEDDGLSVILGVGDGPPFVSVGGSGWGVPCRRLQSWRPGPCAPPLKARALVRAHRPLSEQRGALPPRRLRAGHHQNTGGCGAARRTGAGESVDAPGSGRGAGCRVRQVQLRGHRSTRRASLSRAEYNPKFWHQRRWTVVCSIRWGVTCCFVSSKYSECNGDSRQVFSCIWGRLKCSVRAVQLFGRLAVLETHRRLYIRGC